VPSPNFDERPQGCDVELVVVHNISLPPREFGGPYIDALFTNTLDARAHGYFADIADLRVSAHLLIDRDGRVTQYVPFSRRAWHAGESCFQDRTRCNDFSVGIELEGADDVPFEEMQYRRLAEVIRVIRAEWPGITWERIVGHSDIAPQRKTDPGPAFDWQKLKGLVEANTIPSPPAGERARERGF